jgi:hypothetical protein
VAALFAALAFTAHAQVTHVFDDFSTHAAGGPGEYYLNGLVPSVSANGAAWQEMGWGNWAFVSASGSNKVGVLWGGSTIGAAPMMTAGAAVLPETGRPARRTFHAVSLSRARHPGPFGREAACLARCRAARLGVTFPHEAVRSSP